MMKNGYRARSHVTKNVKDMLLQLERDILPHPAYSPDIALTDYYFFSSVQYGLNRTRLPNAEEVDWIAAKSTSIL